MRREGQKKGAIIALFVIAFFAPFPLSSRFALSAACFAHKKRATIAIRVCPNVDRHEKTALIVSRLLRLTVRVRWKRAPRSILATANQSPKARTGQYCEFGCRTMAIV